MGGSTACPFHSNAGHRKARSRATGGASVVERERSITRLVSSDDTLAEAGLTSLDAVRLVLLVEDDFGIEIPVGELTLANFRSISTISRLVSKMINQA